MRFAHLCRAALGVEGFAGDAVSHFPRRLRSRDPVALRLQQQNAGGVGRRHRELDVAGIRRVGEDESLARLREAVQASPHKSVLIIVWGFRDWFQSAALKTAYTAYVLDINTPVLLFDWPGNQGQGRSGYTASQKVATQSAPDLGRVLAKVTRETGAEHVWLMGSSLGCQTICDAFAWLETQRDLLKDLPRGRSVLRRIGRRVGRPEHCTHSPLAEPRNVRVKLWLPDGDVDGIESVGPFTDFPGKVVVSVKNQRAPMQLSRSF